MMVPAELAIVIVAPFGSVLMVNGYDDRVKMVAHDGRSNTIESNATQITLFMVLVFRLIV